MPFVYVLRSPASGRFYIGSTSELARRLPLSPGEPDPPGARRDVELVRLGSGAATSASEQPENITLAGCEIYAHPSAGSRRGVSLQARNVNIDGCVIRAFKADVEAQAIACWNGPGPYRITHSSLSAAGEVIIFGGWTPRRPA